MSRSARAARPFFFDDLGDLRALFFGQLKCFNDGRITKRERSALLQGNLIQPVLLLRFELGHDRIVSAGELRLAGNLACVGRLVEITFRFINGRIQGGKRGVDLRDLFVAQAQLFLDRFLAKQHQGRERLDQGQFIDHSRDTGGSRGQLGAVRGIVFALLEKTLVVGQRRFQHPPPQPEH